MILVWQLGRAVIWLKRLVSVNERQAIALEKLAATAERLYPTRSTPRHAEFSVATYGRKDKDAAIS